LRRLGALFPLHEPRVRRSQPRLRRAQRPALQLDLPLQVRELPEHRSLAPGQLDRGGALLVEALLHFRQRLRRRGRCSQKERDHVRKNLATASQLPNRPTTAPTPSSTAPCAGSRFGALMPAAKANACDARGRSHLSTAITAPSASAAPSRPCSAPSSRNGART